MKIESVDSAKEFAIVYPVVIIGGGGCGLCAAIAASDGGHEVLLLEQDDSLYGSTGMSTGLIPAAGTAEQTEQNIQDSPEIFAADIQRKASNAADPVVVNRLAQESSETITWLRDTHGVPLSLLGGFTYPGHSAMRMYGMPGRSGAELMASLEAAANNNGVDILTQALVEDLLVDDNQQVQGVRITRPDGETEEIGCQTLILACCGFAGNQEMVEKFMPDITKATFHGHPGNKGHAVSWGEALGAGLADMDAYQGHGGLAYGHGIPILWPLIMEGGFQINIAGARFSDESKGYSEQAVKVLAQQDNVAWSIFDQRLYELMLDFEDFKDAVDAGAIVQADSIVALAEKIKIPEAAVMQTFNAVQASALGEAADEFGRDFTQTPTLTAPYFAVKITGALFHTQGGLTVDGDARVLKENGESFPNLFAGGGAARGVSGAGASGYIAGNGLLTATSLGKIAGRNAATQVSRNKTISES